MRPRALGVSEKADEDKELEAVGGGAKKLRDRHVLLHLQLTPETKVVATRGGPIDAEGEALIKGVEDSARACLDVSQRLGGIADKLTDLEKKRDELRSLTQTGLRQLSPAKRDEIARELDAAKTAIGEDGEKVAFFAGASSKFVVDLARAIETGGNALPASPEPPAAPDKTGKVKPKWAPPPRPVGTKAPPKPSAPPPAAPPKPAAAPPPKKRTGGDDFEP
jgi:hypothetical protein